VETSSICVAGGANSEVEFSSIGRPSAATVTMQKSSPSTATRELASVWLFEAVPDRPFLAGSHRFEFVTKLA
jgi:hypothetical protein